MTGTRLVSPLPTARRTPTGERSPFAVAEGAFDAVVAWFAGWTLVTHVCVFVVSGSFGLLRWLGFAAVLLGALAYRLRMRAGPEPTANAEASLPNPRADRLLHFFVACLLVMMIALGAEYVPFWTAALGYLAIVYLRSASCRATLHPPTATSGREVAWFGFLAVASAVLTAVSHRPDSDDGWLIHSAAWLLDNPEAVLYSADGIHDVPGLPIPLPTYRSHAIEPLFAWLSWLTGLEPIAVAHLLLPPLSAIAGLVGTTLLLRLVLPQAWLLAATALVVFWITMGETHDGFANHAYVRIFQGKAILVTVLLPYLAFAVIRFMQSGRWLDWAMVLAAMAAAPGLSATGVFAAPLALGAAVFACWHPTRVSSVRLVLALASALYPVAVALMFRSDVMNRIDLLNSEVFYGYVKRFPHSFTQILGSGPYLFVQLLGVLGACAVAPDRARRRWFSAAALVYFVFVMNPFVFEFWMRYVTTSPVAWRLWWMLPVPVFVVCTLAAPFASPVSSSVTSPSARARWLRLAAFGLAAAVMLGGVSRRWSLSPNNAVAFDFPRLKVPPREYQLSAIVHRLTPKATLALAPESIATWVPTRPGHPKLVGSKENTVKGFLHHTGAYHFKVRMHLLYLVSGYGHSRDSPAILRTALDSLSIGLVATMKNNPYYADVAGTMDAAGFRRRDEPDCSIWYRRPPP